MNSSFYHALLEVNAYLLILFAVWFALRKWLPLASQRIWILTSPALAVLIWYLKNVFETSGMVYAVIPLNPLVVKAGQAVEINPADSFWSFEFLYWTGVSIALLVLGIKIIRVLYFFRNAKTINGYKLLQTNNKDSFSFFHFIHIRANMNEKEKQVVLEHELIHYRKNHSFDLILFEIFHSLFWYNPVLMLMKKELVDIHEFEVDKEMYANYRTDYLKHLLSYALGSNHSHYLLTSAFYSKLTLKKRINIMKTKSNTTTLLFIIALPVLALSLSVISCQEKEQTQKTEVKTPPVFSKEAEKNGVITDTKTLTKHPEFTGGQEAMYAYLVENMKYPEIARENGTQGRVYVQFIISENGEVSDAEVIRGVSPELDDEALRVILNMPQWTPGEIDGHKVAVLYTLPITFALAE